MADIDKSLPNGARPEDEVAEEIDIEEIKDNPKSAVEILEDEDGATIDFDPSQVDMPEDGGDHFANLNELLPEEDTSIIGNQLQSDYMEYKTSRAEWERAYIVGLDLLDSMYEYSPSNLLQIEAEADDRMGSTDYREDKAEGGIMSLKKKK